MANPYILSSDKSFVFLVRDIPAFHKEYLIYEELPKEITCTSFQIKARIPEIITTASIIKSVKCVYSQAAY